MASSTQAVNPFTQHYLEIAALDPTSPPQPTVSSASSSGYFLSAPLLITFAIIIGGLSYIFIKRFRNARSIFMVFIAALLIGSLPSALSAVSQTQNTAPKASPDITPRNLIVTSVTSQGFAVSWNTNTKTIGALQISEDSHLKQNPLIFDDKDAKDYHRFVVLNLKPGHTYYLQILADSQWFDHSGEPIAVTLPSP